MDDPEIDYSNSDSEPEEVLNVVSKELAFSDAKKATESVQKQKRSKKDKERDRQIRNLQQKIEKEEKKQLLLKKRLPESILDAVEDVAPPTKKRIRKKKEKLTELLDDTELMIDDDEVRTDTVSCDDFIPLESNFSVATYNAVKQKSKSSLEKALEFRNQALFGKNVKRESAERRLSRMKKVNLSGKNVFVRMQH